MQQELKEAFRLYDREGNGYITTSTLKEILGALDDKLTSSDLDRYLLLYNSYHFKIYIKYLHTHTKLLLTFLILIYFSIITEIDTDGSGTVDFDEFMEMVNIFTTQTFLSSFLTLCSFSFFLLQMTGD